MNEQTHTTEETILDETKEQETATNSNAEQTSTEESGNAHGKTLNEQVDFSQMYDMLTERDKTITQLKEEVAELKKTNTNLLLKVNASASAGSTMKTPYESFVDAMVKR
jgi:hypothetical protein